MTGLGTQRLVDSTSASGAMLRREGPHLKLVGVLLAHAGTSSERALSKEYIEQTLELVVHTTAGPPVAVSASAGPSIAELRRLSGLTWEQLARLFRVSRRALHFWASGKPMTPSNEEHLQRLLGVVRKIDRGSASANRSALLTTHDDEAMPFDLLVAGQYERAASLLGTSDAARVTAPKRSTEAVARRAPPPPEELVGALQDRVHPASGRLLGAKAVGVPRRT